jgi:hypothetical protein
MSKKLKHEARHIQHVFTTLSLSLDLITLPLDSTTTSPLSLAYQSARGGEEWQWRWWASSRCWAPTTSTWHVRASNSPQALSYDFVSVDLTDRPCPSTYPCSAMEDQGGGAQARAARWRRLAHHPRWREHHHGKACQLPRRHGSSSGVGSSKVVAARSDDDGLGSGPDGPRSGLKRVF